MNKEDLMLGDSVIFNKTGKRYVVLSIDPITSLIGLGQGDYKPSCYVHINDVTKSIYIPTPKASVRNDL